MPRLRPQPVQSRCGGQRRLAALRARDNRERAVPDPCARAAVSARAALRGTCAARPRRTHTNQHARARARAFAILALLPTPPSLARMIAQSPPSSISFPPSPVTCGHEVRDRQTPRVPTLTILLLLSSPARAPPFAARGRRQPPPQPSRYKSIVKAPIIASVPRKKRQSFHQNK